MKRPIPILASILVIAIATWWIYPYFVSDSTRIEWLLSDMAAGFNASSASRTVGGLAEDFIEEQNRVEKDQLKAFLFQLFLSERDPATKDFRYRVSLDSPRIEVEPSGKAAKVSLLARFERLADKDWRDAWGVKIEAELAKKDGQWAVTRARHETTSGRRPF